MNRASEGNTKEGNQNTSEAKEINVNTREGREPQNTSEAKEGNLNTSEADLTTDFSEDRQRTPCQVQTGPGQELSQTELNNRESENSENSSDSATLDGNATHKNDSVIADTGGNVSDNVGEENDNSERMENRGPRLAPLGSLGGPRKPLPPLQKLAPLGSMERQGSLGSLDKPSLGSIDKQRSLESPKKTLDKTPLGSLKKEGGRQSSLESLGWKGGREEAGRRGSSASSLLSNSSLGARGSFLKSKKDKEQDEDEEDEEDEDEEEPGERVRGILKGSPLKEATDPREGSR